MIAFALPLALLLSACGRPSGDVGPIEYRVPAIAPALPARERFEGSEKAALGGAVRDLERMGFAVETVDESNGLLTATYLGDAERYVDCGSMRLGSEGAFQPASAARLSLRAFPGQPAWVALRQMRLDARLIVRTRNDGFETRLNAIAAYVLTRTVDTLNNEGAVLGTVRETISFETGGVGRFDNGTICHPTGELERSVAGAMATAAAGTLADPFTAGAPPEVPPLPASPAGADETSVAQDDIAATVPGSSPAPRRITTTDSGGIAQSELPEPGLGPSTGELAGTAGMAASAGIDATAEATAGAVAAAGTAAGAAVTAGAVAGSTAAPSLLPGDTDEPAADIGDPSQDGRFDVAALGTPEEFLASDPCADATLISEANGDLRLKGYVAGSADRDRLLRGLTERAGGVALRDETRLLPPGSCEALRLLDDIADNRIDGLSISFKDNEGPVTDGTEVELVVTLPGANRYFYVGYVEEDGRIHHLGPKYIDGAGIGERFLYRTGHVVSAPDGTEMIVAIASREPTFTESRPASENAAQFFSDLRTRIERNPEDYAGIKLVFETGPR